MEEKQLFGALTVYRGRGAFLRRLEQFDKAQAAYDEALRGAPDGDVSALTGRSQACGDAVRPAQAYADAEEAQRLEPRNMRARQLQASARYTMGDFEQALILNYRGARLRKRPSYFQEGINQGLETIGDCVGANSGNVLLDFLPLIKQAEAEKLAESETFGPVRVSRIPITQSKRQLTQLEARKHTTLARVMAMKYLGPMAYDKLFLQDLLEDPRLDSANSGGAADIKSIINETLITLATRQELLREARPYYTIKLAEKSVSKHENKFRKEVLRKEREVGARTAERLLKQIEQSNRLNHVKDVITQAERMQLFLDSKTPRTLPDKEHYIDRLYRDVGEAYLSQHRMSYTLSERGNRRRIAFLMGLPVGRPQSFDSVMANYPYKFIDLKRATQKVFNTLEMCENSTMRCWLMYELARLLCAQKNFALGKFYAKRCQREAQEISSATWWLNGCFVLMSGDMQQGNTNEVKIQVEEAYEWAKKKSDSERVQSFLAKCAEMAAETTVADDRRAIMNRENDIIRALPPDLKADTEVLFKRMSNVPVGRRFTVLPGKLSSDECSERRRRRQRGLSVVPGPERPLPAPPLSRTPGLQLFDT